MIEVARPQSSGPDSRTLTPGWPCWSASRDGRLRVSSCESPWLAQTVIQPIFTPRESYVKTAGECTTLVVGKHKIG